MRYLVTAFPSNPPTQQVFAENGEAAIDAAITNPNRWKLPGNPTDDCHEWNFYAVPVDEPPEADADNHQQR